MVANSIPIVDFAPFMVEEGCVVGRPPTVEQHDVAAQIDDVMREHGFLYLENLNIEEANLSAAFHAAHLLFACPEAHKCTQLKQFTRDTMTGYFPFGKEHVNQTRLADLREAFNVRSPRWHHNDFRGTPPGFGQAAELFWNKAEAAAQRFQIACALAMELPTDRLDSFKKVCGRMDNSTMRFIHYPPCKFEPGVTDGADKSGSIRIGERVDPGMFTFLFLDGTAPGLQVQKVIHEQNAFSMPSWINVPGRGGTGAVVNSGAALARWSRNRWHATIHRVVVHGVRDAACHRYSIPFFIHPDAATVVADHPLSLWYDFSD